MQNYHTDWYIERKISYWFYSSWGLIFFSYTLLDLKLPRIEVYCALVCRSKTFHFKCISNAHFSMLDIVAFATLIWANCSALSNFNCFFRRVRTTVYKWSSKSSTTALLSFLHSSRLLLSKPLESLFLVFKQVCNGKEDLFSKALFCKMKTRFVPI